VDLVFRGGPVTLTATVGSVGSGTVQLSFKSVCNIKSPYIPSQTYLSVLDGRFVLKLASTSTQFIPSGDGWDQSVTTGQLFPRSKVRRR